MTYSFDESVLAFILEWKSGKFQWNKESNTLVTLYWYVFKASPHTQYECGVLFICSKVFQNLHSDKLIDSTLSVFINTIYGVGMEKLYLL